MSISRALVMFASVLGVAIGGAGAEPWLTLEPEPDRANGLRIVLISGDEEYRSEEALPQLARILACEHGFTCTVLFAIDPETGEIDPERRDNIPGLSALDDADLMIIATRFRDLPDDQMASIDRYVRSGRPVIGMRTATHAFNLGEGSAYRHYTWNFNNEHHPAEAGGFGRWLLGETWIAHHGAHGSQSTLGVVAPGAADHPIARGLEDKAVWGPTDVYRVRLPLPEHSTPVVLGQVLDGMSPDDDPDAGEKNNPMMPVAWTRELPKEHAESQRVFTTTMGAATDLVAEGTRVMLVNAVYWTLHKQDDIPASGCAAPIIGTYEPTDFGFGGQIKGRALDDVESACE